MTCMNKQRIDESCYYTEFLNVHICITYNIYYNAYYIYNIYNDSIMM